MKLSLCNLSTIALGQECKYFLYWTRYKRNLLWLVHSSFITVVTFCPVSQTCPPVNDLILLKILKTNLSNTADLSFVVHLGPYWNVIWFLLNSLPISDWLLYQQGLIMFLHWLQICAFSCYFFGINSPNFWMTNWKVFRNSSVMKSLTVRHFSYEYLHKFLGFLHIALFIGMLQALFFQKFKVRWFMDVCARFLN